MKSSGIKAWCESSFFELKMCLFSTEINFSLLSFESEYFDLRSSNFSLNSSTSSSPKTDDGVLGYERHLCFSYKLCASSSVLLDE